jgi:hypothetical protein
LATQSVRRRLMGGTEEGAGDEEEGEEEEGEEEGEEEEGREDEEDVEVTEIGGGGVDEREVEGLLSILMVTWLLLPLIVMELLIGFFRGRPGRRCSRSCC